VNNIYGVDIDRQAVEVTQMSLYLKVLEGENAETLNPQMTLALKEVYLPSLAKNIKCGNSLIGTDFTSQSEMFSDAARHQVNPFDWDIEFEEIIKRGGFDVVIGNPPYVTLTLGKKQKSEEDQILDYYKTHYQESTEYKINTYAIFISKALQLVKENGLFSFITPNTIYTNTYFKNLRKFILDRYHVVSLYDLRYKVFEDAEIGGNAVFVFKGGKEKVNKTKLIQANSIEEFTVGTNQVTVNQDEYYGITDYKYLFDLSVGALLKKIETKGIPLDKLAMFYQGIITGDNKKFIGTKKQSDKWKKILRGKDINRYSLEWAKQYVHFEKKLLWSNTDENMFLVDAKLISRQTSDHLVAVYDDQKYLSLDSTHVIIPKNIDAKYLLSIFNSKLLNFYYQQMMPEIGRTFAQVKIVNLKQLPIRTIDFTKPAEKKMHDDLVSLVEKMLELNKQLQKAHFDSEKEPIKRQIAATDKKIDKLVYDLYVLSEEEIKIVEGKAPEGRSPPKGRWVNTNHPKGGHVPPNPATKHGGQAIRRVNHTSLQKK